MIAQHLIRHWLARLLVGRHWLARLLGRHWLALLPLRIIGVSCHPHRGETWLSDQADGAPELPLFTRLQRQLARAHLWAESLCSTMPLPTPARHT